MRSFLLPNFYNSHLNLSPSTHSCHLFLPLVLVLCLILMAAVTVFDSIVVFLCFCVFLGWCLCFSSTLLSLLFLLMYLGGLIVLVAYFWMLLPLGAFSFFGFYVFLFSIMIFAYSPSQFSGSLTMYLLSSSLLLFFGCFLFLTIVFVVCLVNLSEGSFLS